jgi:hypothetical protein
MLIHLSDPEDQKEGEADRFDPALNLTTVDVLKADWLGLIRSIAADGDALIAQPDLVAQLYRWKKYAGSLTEPHNWVSSAIKTDEGFANIAARMMSTGMSHSFGDRVGQVHNMFSKDAIVDFIGLQVAKVRCETIKPADFPDQALALRALHDHLQIWLGIKEGNVFDL